MLQKEPSRISIGENGFGKTQEMEGQVRGRSTPSGNCVHIGWKFCM